jgi:hypothetical protein
MANLSQEDLSHLRRAARPAALAANAAAGRARDGLMAASLWAF